MKFRFVPNCSKLFQTVPNCSKLFQRYTQFLLVIFLCLVPFFQSCEHQSVNDVVPISEEQQVIIQKLASSLEKNKSVIETLIIDLKRAVEQQSQGVSMRSDDVIDDALIQTVEKFKDNPCEILKAIAQENVGTDALALFAAMESAQHEDDDANLNNKLSAFCKWFPSEKGFVQTLNNNSSTNVGNDGRQNINIIESRIDYDKKMHLLAGASAAMSVGAVAYWVARFFGSNAVKVGILIWGGIAAAVAAGVIKELVDNRAYGVFNAWDLIATILGGGVGVGMSVTIVQKTIPFIISKLGIVSAKATLTYTAVTLSAGTLILGACPALYLISGGRRRC